MPGSKRVTATAIPHNPNSEQAESVYQNGDPFLAAQRRTLGETEIQRIEQTTDESMRNFVNAYNQQRNNNRPQQR